MTGLLLAPPLTELKFSEVLAALSYAMDLTEGQPPGHCLRCCWIGLRIGEELGLEEPRLHDLYYVLLLKDAGCSSNAARLCQLYGSDDLAAKHDFKLVDSQKFTHLARYVLHHTGLQQTLFQKFRRLLQLMRHGQRLANELVATRCERGARIAAKLGFETAVAGGIRSLDEHWNGRGRPEGRRGEEIPVESRIALLAQVADVFHTAGGPAAAREEVQSRRGTWFDPQGVDAFERAASRAGFWEDLEREDLAQAVAAREPGAAVELTEERLDAVAAAFAEVIDAKSPFTAGHSARVARYARTVAGRVGVEPEALPALHRAALLHDIGKLGISNSILDKPGPLSEEEWQRMRLHPLYSQEILARLTPFEEVARLAGVHHERLDGQGYPWGLADLEISREARIITLCDVFDAITADRPYRKAMPLDVALKVMEDMRGVVLDSDCLDALRGSLGDLDAVP